MKKKDMELRIVSLENEVETLQEMMVSALDSIEGLFKISIVTTSNIKRLWKNVNGPT